MVTKKRTYWTGEPRSRQPERERGASSILSLYVGIHATLVNTMQDMNEPLVANMIERVML
jgi:hypothetical protein